MGVTILFGALALLTLPLISRAQSGLSITVTPPLIQLSMGPGETWSSALKIINTNPGDVTYYAEVVNFEATGEEGQSAFVPVITESKDEADSNYTLAQWIDIRESSVTVPRGRSGEVPFTITVPDNAPPGGHYAAILVGTRPAGANASGGAAVSISSMVSSLIFVRIGGDIIEKGSLREFTTDKSLYQDTSVDFALRFENSGNTHLRPRGTITIYNMWGKERGKLMVNEDGNFGNVLPDSIRRFAFSWEGEKSLLDIGPYNAVAALTFGEESRYTVSAKTYFWIVPIVPVSIGLGLVALFLLLITWFIRRYIRRALELEKMHLGLPVVPAAEAPPAPVQPTLRTLVEPLREGVIDMRSLAQRKQSAVVSEEDTALAPSVPKTLTASSFLAKYKLFFLFVVVVVGGSVLLWWYFDRVLEGSRPFQIREVSSQEEMLQTDN